MYNIDTYTGPSFSVKNRLLRVLWNLVNTIFFKYSPRPFHSWRAFILRCFGAKVGKDTHIYPKVHIWAPWNLIVGNNVGIANDVTLYTQDKIVIGDRTTISQNSYLCTGTHDYTTPSFKLMTAPIIIGNDCWIAAGVFIHPKVKIDNGVVVGACSVVNSNLSAWHIYSGNPCKLIKQRNEYYTNR